MFSIHFSVLTNFVMFVCLDVFLKLDFVSMNVSHFFEPLLCLIMIAFTRHFKGHLEISAWTLYHKSHYLESHYQHIISSDIVIVFIGEIEYLYYILCTSLFVFFLVIWHQYHFDNNYLFICKSLLIHSEASIGALDKRMFRGTRPLAFWKNLKTTRKIFGNFQVNIHVGDLFKYTWELFKKLFRAAIPQRSCAHFVEEKLMLESIMFTKEY